MNEVATSPSSTKRQNRFLIINELSEIYNISAQEVRSVDNFRSLCPVKVNGQAAYALIDSGNVVTNAISEEFARKLFRDQFDQAVVASARFRYLGTADKKGNKMKVLGVTKNPVVLRFGGSSAVYKTHPLVLQGLSMAINISGPFLQEHGIDQLHSKGSLRVKGKLVPLITYRHLTKLPDTQSDAAATALQAIQVAEAAPDKRAPETEGIDPVSVGVYIAETRTIRPKSAAYIQLRIPEMESLKLADGEGMVNVGEKFMNSFAEGDSIHPALTTAVTTRDRGVCHTSLLNLSMEPVEIKAGQLFGHYSPVQIGPPQGQVNHLNARPSQSRREKIAWIEEQFGLSQAPWLKGDARAYTQALELFLEYDDIMSREDEYGKTTLIEHEIHTHDVPPIKQKGRPINPVMQEKLREQMEDWKRQGVIEPSVSPWSSSLIPVLKKNGKIRWCVDYRALNAVTLKDSYPLPNIEDNLARLSQSKVFSALDGAGAYHAVTIKKEDRPKTAFHTPWGLWQFCQMPFGLTNSPATYSRLVQRVLEDVPTSIALPYLDDTAVFSRSVSEHHDALRRVFDAFRKAGLMLQPEKCHVYRREVDYLGHTVSAEGIRPREAYLDAVKKWPLPKTIREWRTFLGKASYYRKFIPQFSRLAAPLYNLLGKEADQDPKNVKIGELEETSFETLKKALYSAPILAYPDFDSPEPFILDTDWSKDPGAIGGVLSQVQNGVEKVIAYGARKLTKTEKNYSSNKGELLAVVTFMRYWRYFFQFRPFILRVDHQALQWIRTMEAPNGMIQRWLDTLANYNFTVQFRDGVKHGNADALSRSEHVREPTAQEEKEAEDESCNAIDGLNITAIMNPDVMSKTALREYQERDEVLGKVREWVRTGNKPARADIRQESPELRQYLGLYELLRLDEHQILYRRAEPGEFFQHDRLCLPDVLQGHVLKICHEGTGGHMGIKTTLSRLQPKFYFVSMAKAVEQFVGGCLSCQRKVGRQKDQRHTLVSVQEGSPFQKLLLDYVGPMKASTQGNRYLLTAKCSFTRWLEAIPTNSMTAENTVRLLEEHIISRYGVPEQIHTDQGTNFTSEMFNEVCRRLNIKKTQTPAYNPKSNPVERSHKDLHNIIRAMTNNNADRWEDVLPVALLALRTARNRHTGVTPFYALYGREAPLPLDLMFEDSHPVETSNLYGEKMAQRMKKAYHFIRTNLQAAVERARQDYRGQLQGKPLEVDNLVWLYIPVIKIREMKNKKHLVFWYGPFKILEKISDVMYRIQTHGDWNRRVLTEVVSIDRLRRYKANPHYPPPPMDLTAEDVRIADEFAEQGTEDPDQLPQFRRSQGETIRVRVEVEPPYMYDHPYHVGGTKPPTPPPPPGHRGQEEDLQEEEGDESPEGGGEGAVGGYSTFRPLDSSRADEEDLAMDLGEEADPDFGRLPNNSSHWLDVRGRPLASTPTGSHDITFDPEEEHTVTLSSPQLAWSGDDEHPTADWNARQLDMDTSVPAAVEHQAAPALEHQPGSPRQIAIDHPIRAALEQQAEGRLEVAARLPLAVTPSTALADPATGVPTPTSLPISPPVKSGSDSSIVDSPPPMRRRPGQVSESTTPTLRISTPTISSQPSLTNSPRMGPRLKPALGLDQPTSRWLALPAPVPKSDKPSSPGRVSRFMRGFEARQKSREPTDSAVKHPAVHQSPSLPTPTKAVSRGDRKTTSSPPLSPAPDSKEIRDMRRRIPTPLSPPPVDRSAAAETAAGAATPTAAPFEDKGSSRKSLPIQVAIPSPSTTSMPSDTATFTAPAPITQGTSRRRSRRPVKTGLSPSDADSENSDGGRGVKRPSYVKVVKTQKQTDVTEHDPHGTVRDGTRARAEATGQTEAMEVTAGRAGRKRRPDPGPTTTPRRSSRPRKEKRIWSPKEEPRRTRGPPRPNISDSDRSMASAKEEPRLGRGRSRAALSDGDKSMPSPAARTDSSTS